MAAAGATAGVKITGLHELDRAFAKMSRDVRTEFVWELQEAADPVRTATTQLLLGELANLPRTPVYASMRIGVSARETLVYVAPAWGTRNYRGYGRPRFGGSIRRRMDRALAEHSTDVVKGVEKMIDRMADTWGRGG